MKEVSTKLRQFFIENFMMPADFPEESSFLENGIIDSTGVLELVTFLEENFGIKVEDDEIIPENLDSIKNIKQYLRYKLNGKDIRIKLKKFSS